MANIKGTAANDVINGTTSKDSINGGAGSDVLNGGSGNDYLFGGDTETIEVTVEDEPGYWEEGEEIEVTNEVWVEGYQTDGEWVEGYQTEGEWVEGYQTEGEWVDGYQTEGEWVEEEVWVDGYYDYDADEWVDGYYETQGYQTEGEWVEGYQTEGEWVEGYQTEGEWVEGYQTESEWVEGYYDTETTYEQGPDVWVAAVTHTEMQEVLDGPDALIGAAGDDTLQGGSGGAMGNDTLSGGAGNDLYLISNVKDVIIEAAGAGTDTIRLLANANYTLAANVENLQLGDTATKATGNGLDNIITGNSLANTILGAAGADLLDGGAGNDSLSGGAGNDTLNSGIGLDTIQGGEGNDTAKIDWSTLSGAAITNKVEKITGTSSYKGTITAKNSRGTVLSQVTLDSIESIQLNGKAWSPVPAEPAKPGVSINRISTATNTGEQDTNKGTFIQYNVVLQSAPIENVTINFASSDATEGLVLTPSLTFTAKNWSQPQALKVQGVDDFLEDGNVAYTISGKIKTEDLFYNRISVSVINLINNNDNEDAIQNFKGTSDVDIYSGKNGNDRIYGGADQDSLRGGRGDDQIFGEGDEDRLFGDEGNDKIYGGYENDKLDGGTGDDKLYGEYGQDTLLGGIGNDILNGGEEDDSMVGGVGNDTYYVDDTNDKINDLGATTDIDTVIITQTISYTLGANIENASIEAKGNGNLTGNTLNNDLEGNDGKNVLDGGTGNDSLDGGSGADSLLGGIGNDAFEGGAGNDTMRGGVGVDVADFAAAGVDITVDLSTGRSSGDGTDLLFDIENIIAGEGEDKLTGSDGANDLDGGAGADNLHAGAGKDTLTGCDDGANGGKGEIDKLTGGADADLFELGWSGGCYYNDGSMKATGTSDYALISDFQVGVDRLQLDGAVSNYYIGASVSGVKGYGVWFEQGANDELVAIVQSTNTVNIANTLKVALYV